jgi:hypothetical protein
VCVFWWGRGRGRPGRHMRWDFAQRLYLLYELAQVFVCMVTVHQLSLLAELPSCLHHPYPRPF